jgi:PEP-CTERM motif
MKFARTASIAFAAFVANPATAAVVIDQDAFIAPPGGQPAFGWVGSTTGSRLAPGATVPTTTVLGQTVTAGLSGTLTNIELQYSPTIEGLQLRLYDGDPPANGGQFGGAYFSGTRLGSTGISFDLSGYGYAVQPGQRFSFDLLFQMGPNATAFIGIGTFEGATPPAPPPIINYVNYSGGNAFNYRDQILNPFPLARDIAFRTFVNVAAPAVPEPATWAMMLVGFGMVGVTIRRTSRRMASA